MSEPRVLDANILLRFLTNDLPDQADRVAELLKRLEANDERALLPDLVLADIIWTLEKHYKQPKHKIRAVVEPILALRGLRFSNKAVAREAFDLYVSRNLDWTDTFVAAQMLAKGHRQIYSYDRDFDKVEGIARLEP